MNHLSPNVPAAWKPAAHRAEPGLKVLVVDDNVDAAEILAEALELFGYEVSVCHDGAEALRIAARMRPDVGILDIGLPETDGTELARRLKRTRCTWAFASSPPRATAETATAPSPATPASSTTSSSR